MARMGLGEWLKGFRALHEKARQGGLGGRDLASYHAAREELARALLAAQRVGLQPGQRARRSLRVARALQADLELHDGAVRAMTVDVSPGGFAVLVARAPRLDDEAKVSLRLPGREPLVASARVVEVKQQAGTARASFMLIGLDEAEAERLEMFVFDAVLEQMQG
jgi:PilZ domain